MASECLNDLIKTGNVIIKKQQVYKSDTENDSDDSSNIPCSMSKKRKIEVEYYSWSYLTSKLDTDLDMPNKLCWLKILEKTFLKHFHEIPKQIIDEIICCFVVKNLIQIDSKMGHLSDVQLKLNFLNRSILTMSSALFVNLTHKDQLNKIDFSKLFNYCLNSQSHQGLLIEILRLEPRLTKNLVSKLTSINDKLDSFCLDLLSNTDLKTLNWQNKNKI